MFRIAAVQPRTYPEEREANVKYAVEHIDRAAGLGARIVCLPETYPGPWSPPLDYDAVPDLAAAAQRNGVHVIAGLIEPAPGDDEYYDSLVLLGPRGREEGRYRRVVPEGPWIYRGGSFWDFRYAAGGTLPIFDVGDTAIGMLVCSELYVPELARVLALQGAEIIFMPAGLWKGRQWETWRVLMRARAIENLAYTVTCQNILGVESDHAGLAMVCSPEEVVTESAGVGVIVADCDLARLRELRATQDPGHFGRDKACKANALSQWRRPDVFRRFGSDL